MLPCQVEDPRGHNEVEFLAVVHVVADIVLNLVASTAEQDCHGSLQRVAEKWSVLVNYEFLVILQDFEAEVFS